MPELHDYDVIQLPIITEKGQYLQDEHNQYIFKVAVDANKIRIKETISMLFDIDPEDILKVRTMVMPGKRGNRGRKRYIRKHQWKKAVVTLAEGVSIELFNV